MQNPNHLTLLKNSLLNISKPYQEQINLFPNYVDVFDELLSDFDNAFRLLPLIMEEEKISYRCVLNILKCNNIINLTMEIEGKQTDESFENDNEWMELRRTAQKALNLIE
ncbi:MAG: hypothetical protein EOP52_05680 [Sphingobacteriales bacterium]|nr:MAG: hypothetical protein EOP52_05680 [Sphingobacteriales bacterium]